MKGSLHLQLLDDVAAVDVIGYGVAPCVGVRGDEVPLLTDDACNVDFEAASKCYNLLLRTRRTTSQVHDNDSRYKNSHKCFHKTGFSREIRYSVMRSRGPPLGVPVVSDHHVPPFHLHEQRRPFQVRQKKAGDFLGAGVQEGVAAHDFRICQSPQVVLAPAGLLHSRRYAVGHEAVFFRDIHSHGNEVLSDGVIRQHTRAGSERVDLLLRWRRSGRGPLVAGPAFHFLQRRR